MENVQIHQQKTINRGGVIGPRGYKRWYSHSQHRLVTTYIGGGWREGLWITVQVWNQTTIKQTVHTSSNNNQYIFMPVLYARDLTRLDGFKQYGLITSTEDTAWKLTAECVSVAILSCQTHGMEWMEMENLVLAAFDVEWMRWCSVQTPIL